MRIVSAILLILGGIAVIIYHQQIYKMFGRIDWAERNLGDSRTIYVLSGCGLITLGIILLLGGGGGVQDTQQLQLGGA